MEIILINASAAKKGGAETIIRTFVSKIPNDRQRYLIISPLEFDITGSNNILIINKKTNGLNTIFFTLIGIMTYVIKYKPTKIISFNNINYIFSGKKGITYFHQLKALKEEYSDIKIKIYDLCIRFFLRKNIFIVQSDLIKNLFIEKYKFNQDQVISSWPGFEIPKSTSLINFIDIKRDFLFVGILPIAYVSEHKNIDSLKTLLPEFVKNNIGIITLLDEDKSPLKGYDNIINIGSVSRSELFGIYEYCDFMIFPSKTETVGLPIFEFMQTGKPVFVYKADYSQSYYKQFGEPENLILYINNENLIEKLEDGLKSFDNSVNYALGEWDKLFKLL